MEIQVFLETLNLHKYEEKFREEEVEFEDLGLVFLTNSLEA